MKGLEGVRNRANPIRSTSLGASGHAPDDLVGRRDAANSGLTGLIRSHRVG